MQDSLGISLLAYAAGIGHPKFSHLLKLLQDTARPESLGLVCCRLQSKDQSFWGGPGAAIQVKPTMINHSHTLERRASLVSGVPLAFHFPVQLLMLLAVVMEGGLPSFIAIPHCHLSFLPRQQWQSADHDHAEALPERRLLLDLLLLDMHALVYR